ncbi:E3 SUMO-protein ligase KIAA1586-like [Palaemon carinicauda]|uniref:E3 SUMO-protein ligase KIAA1586-like n=1 Tax=Palaemon carinicauda TaxID=392227 RepID=UPI0035B5C01B
MEVPSDTRNAYCKYCKTTIRAKFCDIKDHSKSKKHQVNSEPFSSSRQSKISFPKAEKSRDVARAEAQLCLFIAKHCAISSCDDLVDIIKKRFSDKTATELAMHRSKCTAVLKNVLMPHFIAKLKEDIGDRKYSILLDESTDISVVKYLGLAIHYFSENSQKLVSTFLHLAPLEDCDANGIVHALKSSLRVYGLNLQIMVGIGTDNASVMVGINNGVYKKLKEDIPALVHIRCVCHSVQLSVSHASKETVPRNLEFLSVLSEVQRVNKIFESNDCDPAKLLDDLTLLIENLVKRVILPANWHRIDPFTCNLEEYIVPKLYLGYETENLLSELPKHLPEDREKNLRERCSKFLIILIKELRNRLPDNVQVLKTMSLLSVENTLRVVKNSIVPLLESLSINPESITKIEFQWSNITLVKWCETKDTVKFWAEVKGYKDAANINPYEELSSVALTVLSLPHSNAEIERVFSHMNIIITKLRNKMKTDTTNALLHIRYGLKRI